MTVIHFSVFSSRLATQTPGQDAVLLLHQWHPPWNDVPGTAWPRLWDPHRIQCLLHLGSSGECSGGTARPFCSCFSSIHRASLRGKIAAVPGHAGPTGLLSNLLNGHLPHLCCFMTLLCGWLDAYPLPFRISFISTATVLEHLQRGLSTKAETSSTISTFHPESQKTAIKVTRREMVFTFIRQWKAFWLLMKRKRVKKQLLNNLWFLMLFESQNHKIHHTCVSHSYNIYWSMESVWSCSQAMPSKRWSSTELPEESIAFLPSRPGTVRLHPASVLFHLSAGWGLHTFFCWSFSAIQMVWGTSPSWLAWATACWSKTMSSYWLMCWIAWVKTCQPPEHCKPPSVVPSYLLPVS